MIKGIPILLFLKNVRNRCLFGRWFLPTLPSRSVRLLTLSLTLAGAKKKLGLCRVSMSYVVYGQSRHNSVTYPASGAQKIVIYHI
jgi:hypothetical protein